MSFPRSCTKVVIDGETTVSHKSVKSKILPGGGGGLQLTPEQMNEIFRVGSSGRIPILITMHQNIDALRFSPLMPIIVQIRVPSANGESQPPANSLSFPLVSLAHAMPLHVALAHRACPPQRVLLCLLIVLLRTCERPSRTLHLCVLSYDAHAAH
jgi:hypothetical protein